MKRGGGGRVGARKVPKTGTHKVSKEVLSTYVDMIVVCLLKRGTLVLVVTLLWSSRTAVLRLERDA